MEVNDTPQFLVDFMLGRLARWLRAFGYDAVYVTEKTRADLILRSLKENRVLVTRDRRLGRKKAWKLVLIRDDRFTEQIKQLADELHLRLSSSLLFSRCTVCNTPITVVTDKEEVRGKVPEYVFQTHDSFCRCTGCGRIYWQGTHQELLLRELEGAGIKLCDLKT